MLQFTSPRARFPRKNRFNLRAIALATALIAVTAYAAVQHVHSTHAAPADVTADVASITAPQSLSPNAATAEHGIVATNLKAAFDAAPTPATYQYGATVQSKAAAQPTGRIALDASAASMAAVEPAAGGQAPTRAAGSIATQLSAIQSGISKILHAGGTIVQRHVAVGKGDTLMDLLTRNNVPRTDAFNAVQALRKVYNPRDLNIGHEITVFFHNDPAAADPGFSGLRIQKDIVSSVFVKRDEGGNFEAKASEKPVHRTLRAFSGTVDNSLYVSAKAQGMPDAAILEMIKMYSWVVDFQREIQSGDKFDMLYEEYVTDDGQPVPGRGNILYANLSLADHRALPLYRYEDAQGNVDYFDASGQSIKKPLMRTPVNSAHIRISSRFGMRFHPILGYSKMHKGIDFAVPRGTQIYAAGDGVIERIGPFSTYGNYVRIRHRKGLETAYAHMRGFRPGLRRGSHVKQGEVIGYVGTTGRSTGPHLHYEILINGKQVNPATVKVAGGRALAGRDLRKFKGDVASIRANFRKLESQAQPAMASATAAAQDDNAANDQPSN